MRLAAEKLARDALSDGNLLRRERRIAWRAAREPAPGDAATADSGPAEPASAALLESSASQGHHRLVAPIVPAQRDYLLTMDRSRLPAQFLMPPDEGGVDPASGGIDEIRRRALRRAEQLSNIYLEEADRAGDQGSMELAQKLAAQSIVRLAGLRNIASVSASR